MQLTTNKTPKEILDLFWGYPDFRGIQSDIINHALTGNDTFALMRTGGGKSICFQLPTMMTKGLTIVISPLIALMKDQVDGLRDRGISAAFVNSTQDARTINSIYIDCVDGKYKFLYVSPERLKNKIFFSYILRCKISFIVIDEAHTISQWGFDFRTSYQGIVDFKNCFPKSPLMALTATATGFVKEEIIKTLQLREGYKIFESSFARSNLNIRVLQVDNKTSYLIDYISKKPSQTGIIYVNRRLSAEGIAAKLKKHGIKSEFYHGGLTPQQKTIRQENWKSGNANVMVCTNAFGMGIDKADVRFVFHVNFPESLEAYWQESGRAGRDGLDSDAIFLYSSSDIKDHLHHELKFPDFAQIKDTYYSLIATYAKEIKRGETIVFKVEDIARRMQADVERTFRALRILEVHKFISMQSGTALKADVAIQKERKEIDKVTRGSYKLQIMMIHLFKEMRGKSKLGGWIEIDMANWRKGTRMDMDTFMKFVEKLIVLGFISYKPKKPLYLCKVLRKVKPEDFSLRVEEVTNRQDYLQAQQDLLMSYVTNNRDCRVSNLLSYFDEFPKDDCGKCDVCLAKKEFKERMRNNASCSIENK